MEIFQQNVKKTLKMRHITQRELAAMIGVKPQSLWVWLHETFPPMERFLQICQALQITPNELLGVTERTDYQNNQV